MDRKTYTTLADLQIAINKAIEEHRDTRMRVSIYNDAGDFLSHAVKLDLVPGQDNELEFV